MPDPAPPLISVIVPAFNAARYFPAVLDCIAGQGIDPLEVIVVDDGSTDETSTVAARHHLPVRVLRRENGGPGAARNAGLDAARGSLIAFLDVDDYWPQGSLRVRLDALQSRPNVQMVLGLVRFEGLRAPQVPLPWPAPNLGAGLYRREVFTAVGIFEPSLRMIDDVDWFWRARDANIVTEQLETVTLHYRRHDDSLIAAKSWKEQGLPVVIRRALERRRRGLTSPSLKGPPFSLKEQE